MQTPRCSLPDDDDQTVQTSALHSDVLTQRMKRAASTWTRRNINWRLSLIFYQLFFFLIFHPAFTYLMVSTQYHSKEKYKKHLSKCILSSFFTGCVHTPRPLNCPVKWFAPLCTMHSECGPIQHYLNSMRFSCFLKASVFEYIWVHVNSQIMCLTTLNRCEDQRGRISR